MVDFIATVLEGDLFLVLTFLVALVESVFVEVFFVEAGLFFLVVLGLVVLVVGDVDLSSVLSVGSALGKVTVVSSLPEYLGSGTMIGGSSAGVRVFEICVGVRESLWLELALKSP